MVLIELVHKGGGEITTTKEADEKSGDVTRSQINRGDNNETKKTNKTKNKSSKVITHFVVVISSLKLAKTN